MGFLFEAAQINVRCKCEEYMVEFILDLCWKFSRKLVVIFFVRTRVGESRNKFKACGFRRFLNNFGFAYVNNVHVKFIDVLPYMNI